MVHLSILSQSPLGSAGCTELTLSSAAAPQPPVSDSWPARVQVCKARTLHMCGEAYRHAAALLVSEALHRDPEHEDALLEYVRIVQDRGHTADAVRILLRLLVNSRERTTVRRGTSQAAHCVFGVWRMALVESVQGQCWTGLKRQRAPCCGSQ